MRQFILYLFLFMFLVSSPLYALWSDIVKTSQWGLRDLDKTEHSSLMMTYKYDDIFQSSTTAIGQVDSLFSYTFSDVLDVGSFVLQRSESLLSIRLKGDQEQYLNMLSKNTVRLPPLKLEREEK